MSQQFLVSARWTAKVEMEVRVLRSASADPGWRYASLLLSGVRVQPLPWPPLTPP